MIFVFCPLPQWFVVLALESNGFCILKVGQRLWQARALLR
jgi:hypothetical protein